MEIERSAVHVDVQSPVIQLRTAIADMIDDASSLAENGDWESLIRGLGPLQEVLGDLRILESSVKQYIADTIPERQVTVEGVGTVEKMKKTTRRNWDSEELLRKIVVTALIDPETGEIPSSPVEAVDKVMGEVKACVPFTGSTSWRVGALKERGYDPDEWCEQNTDGYTIKFLRKNKDV